MATDGRLTYVARMRPLFFVYLALILARFPGPAFTAEADDEEECIFDQLEQRNA